MICPRYLNLFQKQKAIFVEEQSRDFESTKNKVHCTFMPMPRQSPALYCCIIHINESGV